MSERDWRLIREEGLDGATAMAYDEVAAETVAEGGPATVRVYRWLPSTLSLGYHQPADDVDFDYCDYWDIQVTRRPTGGGAIYHDTNGDISYSIVAPAGAVPGDLLDAYELLCEPLFDCFEELGVDARFVETEREAVFEPACYLRSMHPAHDIVAGEDGRKISGNAQYRQKDAVVQHGSLTYDLLPEQHLGCFTDPGVEPTEFRERVTSITDQAGGPYQEDRDLSGEDVHPMAGIDTRRSRAVRVLEEALADWAGAEEGEWTAAETDRAETIAADKYESEAWVREREDPTN